MAQVVHDSCSYRHQAIMFLKVVALSFVAAVCVAQHQQYYAPQNELTTPSYPRNYHPPAPVHYVNIGAQLAGDYKFGYDTGKGPLGQSFREETRLPDGTVKGAYGVLDADGKQRIIRYTAGKNGFSAEGDVGPDGAPGVAPGPAPQPQPAPYQPQARYNPAPAVQQYNPAPAAAPVAQQYRPQMQHQARSSKPYRTDGQWDPKYDDEYYDSGPAYIDVERLSYNIGTAQQG